MSLRLLKRLFMLVKFHPKKAPNVRKKLLKMELQIRLRKSHKIKCLISRSKFICYFSIAVADPGGLGGLTPPLRVLFLLVSI